MQVTEATFECFFFWFTQAGELILTSGIVVGGVNSLVLPLRAAARFT